MNNNKRIFKLLIGSVMVVFSVAGLMFTMFLPEIIRYFIENMSRDLTEGAALM